tara:strand:+ start:1548 stop:2576 length:1029 start_codon:yes stop_codon:yes gene_type:complete
MPNTLTKNGKTYLIFDFDCGRERGFADILQSKDLYLKAKDKPYIVISNSYEGEIHHKQADQFLERIHAELRGYEHDKIVLVMADANLEKNYERWYKNYKEPKVIGHCVYYPYTLLKRTIEHFNTHKIKKKYMDKKPKHFICLNAAAKPHRFHVVETFFSNDWHHRGYITYLNRYGANTKHLANENFQGQDLTLDFNAKTIDEGQNQEILPPEYREACFDVVTESIVSDTSIFITEKTWKPILYKVPFLPLGSKTMCKHLEDFFGIKPYYKLFNYSFDYINYPDRLHRIKEDNLRRLINTPIKEMNELINSDAMQKLLSYNQTKLINLEKPMLIDVVDKKVNG